MDDVPRNFACAYKVVDDCHILADVYLPERLNGSHTIEKRPLLLFFHGGGFLLGARESLNQPQLRDWLRRGWIVASCDYRLCPQVDIYTGPICDAQDAAKWAVSQDEHGLNAEIARNGEKFEVDPEKIIVCGTSSGGTLAYSTVFGPNMPRIAAVVDFFGAKHYLDPIWEESTPGLAASITVTPEMEHMVLNEKPVCTNDPILDGRPDPRRRSTVQNARLIYAMKLLNSPNFRKTCLPSGDYSPIDAAMNINDATVKIWPPCWIIHGLEDERIDVSLSRKLHQQFLDHGIKSKLIECPGEPHSFVQTMEAGTKTWDLQFKAFDEVEQLINGQ